MERKLILPGERAHNWLFLL